MYIDRPALKRQAKNLISSSKPQPIVVGLVYVLLILLISWLSGKMSGLDFSTNELIEYSNTEQLFSQPKEKKTEDYITGRFG